MKGLRACCALARLLWLGCAVGPNYHRPQVSTPTVYRSEVPSSSAQPSTASVGNEKWWEVFQDPVLQQLIRTALQQNYDVRTAATRVLEAQTELGITRANQYPTATAGGLGRWNMQAFTQVICRDQQGVHPSQSISQSARRDASNIRMIIDVHDRRANTHILAEIDSLLTAQLQG